MSQLPEQTLERLRAELAAEPDIEVAALFGSAALGRLGPESDVDIYLRLRPGVDWSLRRRLDLAAQLTSAARREVDLIVEDEERTSVILRREMARTGLLLHERTPGAWTSLRARAMLAYADLEPFIRRCGEGVRRAILRRAENRDG